MTIANSRLAVTNGAGGRETMCAELGLRLEAKKKRGQLLGKKSHSGRGLEAGRLRFTFGP